MSRRVKALVFVFIVTSVLTSDVAFGQDGVEPLGECESPVMIELAAAIRPGMLPPAFVKDVFSLFDTALPLIRSYVVPGTRLQDEFALATLSASAGDPVETAKQLRVAADSLMRLRDPDDFVPDAPLQIRGSVRIDLQRAARLLAEAADLYAPVMVVPVDPALRIP